MFVNIGNKKILNIDLIQRIDIETAESPDGPKTRAFIGFSDDSVTIHGPAADALLGLLTQSVVAVHIGDDGKVSVNPRLVQQKPAPGQIIVPTAAVPQIKRP